MEKIKWWTGICPPNLPRGTHVEQIYTIGLQGKIYSMLILQRTPLGDKTYCQEKRILVAVFQYSYNLVFELMIKGLKLYR